MMLRLVRLALVAAVLAAGEARAQALHPVGSASLVTARVRSQVPAGIDQFTGSAFLGQGALAMGRVELSASYLQGTLNRDGGTAAARDLVEGTVRLGVRALDWLTLETGPHARAYTLTAGTERWLFWELRARAASAFVGSAVQGYAELWRALSADANVPEPFDHAQGGEVGMVVRFTRTPLAARVGYRIDHAVLGGGTRLETVDGVVIGVGVAWR
jgi:hypothetical protein